MPVTFVKLKSRTYSSEVVLGIVFFPSVKIIEDGGEAAATAATELGLESEDGNAVLVALALELLGDLGLDGGLLNAGALGVDQLNHL